MIQSSQVYKQKDSRMDIASLFYRLKVQLLLNFIFLKSLWELRFTRARFLKAEEYLLYLLEKCKDEKPDPTAK